LLDEAEAQLVPPDLLNDPLPVIFLQAFAVRTSGLS